MADGRDIKYAQWGGRKPAYMNALEAAQQGGARPAINPRLGPRIMPVGDPQILPEEKASLMGYLQNPRNAGRPAPSHLNGMQRDPNVKPTSMNFQDIALALGAQASQASANGGIQNGGYIGPVRMPINLPSNIPTPNIINGMSGSSPGRRNVGAGSPGMRPRGDGRDRANSMAGLGAAYQQARLGR